MLSYLREFEDIAFIIFEDIILESWCIFGGTPSISAGGWWVSCALKTSRSEVSSFIIEEEKFKELTFKDLI